MLGIPEGIIENLLYKLKQSEMSSTQLRTITDLLYKRSKVVFQITSYNPGLVLHPLSLKDQYPNRYFSIHIFRIYLRTLVLMLNI